jgi:hypothetical protein
MLSKLGWWVHDALGMMEKHATSARSYVRIATSSRTDSPVGEAINNETTRKYEDTQIKYSLRSILLFVNTDISRHILVVDISVSAKSNMGRREYFISCRKIFSLFETHTRNAPS